ncbi:MAG TPA: MBL fold metallo-hydrolase [Rubrobacter sp.]|nr:MBL fold metallo-hydrolase [Rubrobacter sp.]
MSDDPTTGASPTVNEGDGPQRPGEAGLRRLTFLGTGDALNGERAQSGLALPLSGGETMLIDTSSGTVLLGRLEAAGIPLESVRHLFLSHRHFDHVGGFAPLLATLASLPEASLVVHAAPDTLRALRQLLDLTLPGAEGWLGERLGWRELIPGKPTEVGETEVTPFSLDHGLECVGFRIAQPGAVAALSVDTRPTREIAENASGADLLVHDAYGPRGAAEQAHAMGHSTATEAGEAARAAGVRRLVLTHLRSSRFVDPAALAAEAETVFGGPVSAAQDLETIEF